MTKPVRLPRHADGVAAHDALRRPLHDLRLSVTDRCNFRCTYCMPKEVFGRDWSFLPRQALLSFEEIARITRIFVDCGVEKVRITGGEPLLRHDLEHLIELLAAIEGVRDLTLTTNGAALADKARLLKEAGLQRLTVSLDALDDAIFRRMNDVNFPVGRVLEGIQAASEAGLSPIKINTVVKRGVNEDSILEVAEYFRHTGHIVRFIEYMDVGHSNGWKTDEVIPAVEILNRIRSHWALQPVRPNYPGEVATRYRYTDGGGEVGIIASVTQPFCGGCSRARITAEGQLYTCLFASRGQDLRRRLRGGATDAELRAFVRGVWGRREDRYSELRGIQTSDGTDRVEMSRVGG